MLKKCNSSVSNEAVGAVGTANTYIGIFIIMFSGISSGMIAVMTQYIGAKRVGVAYQARQLGLAVNAAVGAALSLFLFFFAGKVLMLVGVADRLLGYAVTYLKIVGGCCILNALIPIFSSYLRAFGHTRYPLAATIAGNAANLVLNSVFLFGFHMGVKGVAIATVISKALNLLLVVLISCRLVNAGKNPERIENRKVLKQIIKIGLPSAMETGLYNLAMTLIIRFLNQMDADGVNVTARSYAVQITNFSYCAGAALAHANAIMTGWRIGAGRYEECDRGTKKAAIVGVAVAAVLESVFAASSGNLMRLFTDDPMMIALVGRLLAVDIVLEIGRAANLVFGIASDECVRAVCMFLRWQSGKWKEKSLIRREA